MPPLLQTITHTPLSAKYIQAQPLTSFPQVHRLVAPRDQKYQSNFVEFRNNKIVYRRYAGLFFCACVDANDNELAYLEAIHFFVEVLDSFFGNVCELDLVFNFYKVRCFGDAFERLEHHRVDKRCWGEGIGCCFEREERLD